MEYIYIFVNPESGGKLASNFVEPSVQELKFSQPVQHTIRIHSIFDGNTGEKPGFIELAQLIKHKDDDKRVFVIVAGGDGSVTWVVSEVEKHGIDFDAVIFGIFPYGTGNDLARALHWNLFSNLVPFGKNLMPLRKAIKKVLESEIVPHDFWNIFITVEPEGSFNKINQKTKQKDIYALRSTSLNFANSYYNYLQQTIVDEYGVEVKSMEFMMGNYFSIGTESRIGRGFDRHRSSTMFMNKLRYVTEGLKRAVLGKVRVERQIDKMLCGELFNEIVFVTERNDENIPVLPKSVSFIATNIPSFSAGLDCFKHGKKGGLIDLSKDESEHLRKAEQKMGDGRLEFISYKSLHHLALDFLITGHSRRVHVGEGPWKIIFKQLTPNEKAYFQIDGEFFVMLQPKEVVIRHMKCINILQ